MEKEFVTYEQALSLQELEPDEFDGVCLAGSCFAGYFKSIFNGTYDLFTYYEFERQTFITHLSHPDTVIPAPTRSQTFRWFREKHNLFVQPNETKDKDGNWYYFSITGGKKRTEITDGSFKYEEAELACLNKLIEIVKEKS